MNEQEAAAKIDSLLRTLLLHSGLSLVFSTEQSSERNRFVLDVTFTGADVPVLLSRNAELLLAFEHIAIQALGLSPDKHDQVSFDAGGFKAERNRRIAAAAESGQTAVRASGLPHHFPPMNSRERRLLHLALADSGLQTKSEGEGPQRHLVLHPATTRI